MAVIEKDKKTKLKIFFGYENAGVKKTRIVTINDIDEKAANEHLYTLSEQIAGLVTDDLTKIIKADDVLLEQQ